MNQSFRVIVIGGTGQVGSAVVQSLRDETTCREVVMVTRKPAVLADPGRVRRVVMDTGAAEFDARVADLTRQVAAEGDLVSAVSCVGVGIPGPWGSIDQRDIGTAFSAEITRRAAEPGTVFYDNRRMRHST